MAGSELTHAALNEVLVALKRSLLQYVHESWPWTESGTDSEQAAVAGMVRRQESHVARLTELLADRRWGIDYGVYPAEYTDLHYVALSYLLRLLVQSETAVLGQTDEALLLCGDDPDARRLLHDAAADQREIIAHLRQMTETRHEGTRAAG